MKKFSFISLVLVDLFGCAKQSEVDNLQKQIDELKSDQIASVDTQIASIRASIRSLEKIDTELRGYITTLQQMKESLEQADEALGQDISELEQSLANKESALHEEISAAEANVFAQLQSYKTTIDGQISTINTTIAQLLSKDTDLQNQINNLKTYIDGQIQSTRDWASATFVTLAQFNATAEIIAGIQGQITSITQQVAQLENTVPDVTQEDLNALDESLRGKITEAVGNCITAISIAKDEITAAYTTAIRTAIASSESSMKNWVNNQLTGYYTISQTDAKLASLETILRGQLDAQRAYLEGLIGGLEASLLQKINTNGGLIEGLQNQINGLSGELSELSDAIVLNTQHISENAGAIAANARNIATDAADIDACEEDILQIWDTIRSMQQDIENLQEKVEAILARIQSLSFVPKYTDGEVRVNYNYDGAIVPGSADFIFEVHPASAATDLASVWQTAISMKAVHTITKVAPELVILNITDVTADNGFLTITVSGSALKEDFYLRRCGARASLTISDGVTELASDYIPMTPTTEDVITFNDVNLKNYMVANFDKNGDGEISHPEACDIQTVNCPNASISDMTGLEHLCNLKYLNVSGNEGITAIPTGLSSTLEILKVSDTSLIEIDLSNYPLLVDLDISSTPITSLDLSANTLLQDLNIADTPFKSTVLIGYDLSIGVVFYNSGSVVKVIPKDESRQAWGYYGVITGASSDSDGMSNTNIILSGSPAAQWCRKKGENWYLPAPNELADVDEVVSEINTTLSSLMCNLINLIPRNFGYWTSREWGTNGNGALVYYFGWEDAGWESQYSVVQKNNLFRVRAVRAL